jgi:serine protease
MTFSPFTIDSFKIVNITTDAALASEHKDWAIRHAGLGSVKYTGNNQKVGVIDTGVDPQHQDLEGQVTAQCFIGGCSQVPNWRDDCGHGQFVTGQIVARKDGKGVVGVAPDAKAFHARVLYGDKRDNARRTIEQDLADAIRACTDNKCGVISMSLGGPGASRVCQHALEYAVSKGVIPLAAAGNEKMTGSPYASYPASYPTVISVAAANKDSMPAWFSSRGRTQGKPEISVASLEYYWGCLPGRSAYGTMIGTSQSTPIVSGVALLWREMRVAMAKAGKLPELTGDQWFNEFKAWLIGVADDTNRNGWDPELGWGVLTLTPADLP